MNKQPITTESEMFAHVREVAADFLDGKPVEFEYRPTGHEQVVASISEMKPIPANANPFNYDSFSMGTHLPRDWTVMHPGFDNKSDPQAMLWLYLVNTRTGQRIQVNLEHVPTAEQIEQQKQQKILREMEEVETAD